MNLLNRISKKFRPKSASGKQEFIRKYERIDCSFVSQMVFLDTSAKLDGIVNEISQGGAIFRPAQSYILQRQGETIGLELNGISVSGTIITTRSFGYAIKFFKDLSQEEMDQALANAMVI
ncbi:MAG: hypothetical protein COB13_000670 [OCS116 cluster bacterium]|nr:hypothetical protein [OCS116 cluster bacterium]